MLPHFHDYATIVKMRFYFLNHHSTFQSRLKNEKGQVALFIALIFQILFLFFAMVINVGLLVHHKINLQNSVDLAAYYGAMKQAENMNVIAHTNYQIRQSWKLLSWRYRAIGSAGDFLEHPYAKSPAGPRGDLGETTAPYTSATLPDFYDAPPFCATYVPFKPMPKDENTCKSISRMGTISLFKAPAYIAGHQAFSASIRNASLAYRESAIERCRVAGTYNYILFGSFIVSYNIDQGDRSLFITQMARSMSNKTDDFWDIDGQSVKLGMEKTFQNNLTVANRDGITEFSIYNSLANERCNASGRGAAEPPKWLNTINAAPGFVYVDQLCGERGKPDIYPVAKPMPSSPSDTANFPQYWQNARNPEQAQIVQELSNFIGFRQPGDPYNFSVGVEKNPWCMAYVGVKAETSPKIPFSLGPVKLIARAFAKPFGGRIGPWYRANWSPGSLESNSGKRVDPLLPPKMSDKALLANPKDPTRAPNYSRFVGDQYGIKTRNFHYQFGRAIYELDERWKRAGPDGYLAVSNGVAMDYKDEAPNFEHWTVHLPFEFAKKEGNWDILAWANNGPSRMRDLELSAILPDSFDMAYYSIEPDFYHNYYKRIRDGFLRSPAGSSFDKAFRPDIGFHKDYNTGGMNLREFSVKDQYQALKTRTVENIDFDKAGITWISKDWKNLLTGWAAKDLSDFSLDPGAFGKCMFPAGDEKLDVPTSGNCAVGGTTGYSVKSVSSDYLKKTDLELGGSGGGQGPLLNPPPDDF